MLLLIEANNTPPFVALTDEEDEALRIIFR